MPWKKSLFNKTKALAVWNEKLIVGLSGGEPGSASIYMFDNKKWLQIGGAKTSINKKWEKLNNVHVLQVHNGNLFAGINNTVWQFNNNKWTLLETGSNNSFPLKDGRAYSMASHNGFIFRNFK